MGEQKEQPKNETEKKPEEGAAKKDDAPAPVVYKLDLHCEGCIKKIKRTVRHFQGVENVKADLGTNKVTVTGNFDAGKLQAKLAEKTKKKVDLVSAPPKKDAGAGAGEKPSEKKPDEKEKKPEEKEKKSDEKEKKPDEKKPEEKKPKESTVVMKIRLHCDGCITKIKRMILKFKGVESVNLDGEKDLVTVKGTMEPKELVAYVSEKTKRNVDVVPPKKEEDNKKEKEGGEKKEKEKEKSEGGGEKKEDGAAAAAKVEVSKMEYQYPLHTAPMYWYDGVHEQGASSSSSYGGYGMEVQPMYGGGSNHYVEPTGYNNVMNQGYPMQQPAPYYMHSNLPPPQMFSDENPNACSVM